MTTFIKHGDSYAIDGLINHNGRILDQKYTKFVMNDNAIVFMVGMQVNIELSKSTSFDHTLQSIGNLASSYPDTRFFIVDRKDAAHCIEINVESNGKCTSFRLPETYTDGSGAKYAQGVLVTGGDIHKAMRAACICDTQTSCYYKSFAPIMSDKALKEVLVTWHCVWSEEHE